MAPGGGPQVTPGANGVTYVASLRPRTPGAHDLVLRKLGPDGRTIRYLRLPTARPVDLAVGAGGLYLLTHHRLWCFPA